LSVTKTGEVQIHGGELAVEETDGIVHDLVFTDENGDIKKVYLKKEAITIKPTKTNGNYTI